MIGAGVLKGMGVTLKTFVGTYPWGRGLLRALGIKPTDGLVTIQYPDVKQEHSERFRYFPFLVYDHTPDNLRCVACKICEQECPPQCIHIVGPAKDEQGRPLKAHGRTYPVKFDIDVSICMQCRICVDVCPFDAIEMDKVYELAGENRAWEMNYTKDKLLKSAEYFKQIRPDESAVVEARVAQKRAKAAALTPSQPAQAPSQSQPPQS